MKDCNQGVEIMLKRTHTQCRGYKSDGQKTWHTKVSMKKVCVHIYKYIITITIIKLSP